MGEVMAVPPFVKHQAMNDLKRGMLAYTVARKYGFHWRTVEGWKEQLAAMPMPEKVFKPYYNPKFPYRVCRAIDAVAKVYFDVLPDVSAIVPMTRGKDGSSKPTLSINHPRAVMYLVLKDCGKSTTQIGMWFRRHHSTIMYGIQAAQKRIADGDPLATQAYNDAMVAMGEREDGTSNSYTEAKA
jgi:hypothetical protein